MKKKFISLLAACSMLSTVAMGLVQTAYAEDDPISIVVSDGATDTEKILTIYYNCDGIMTFDSFLTFDNSNVTIGKTTFNMTYTDGDKNAAVFRRNGDPHDGEYQIMILTYGEGEDSDLPMETADKSIATVKITVPGDVDVKASLALKTVEESDWTPFPKSTVTVTIPANASQPETPATVEASVEEAKAYVNKNDESDCAVVGKINLTVGGSIDLADATYEGNKAQAITDTNDQALASTTITDADILLFVVINGTTDIAELDKVVFE